VEQSSGQKSPKLPPPPFYTNALDNQEHVLAPVHQNLMVIGMQNSHEIEEQYFADVRESL